MYAPLAVGNSVSKTEPSETLPMCFDTTSLPWTSKIAIVPSTNPELHFRVSSFSRIEIIEIGSASLLSSDTFEVAP